MKVKLLEIRTSVRQQDSISSQLSSLFVDAWRLHHPNVQHIIRDVGVNYPAMPDDFWVKVNYTLPEERTQEMIEYLAPSDALIDEFLGADYIVLAVPMYNLSVPATFKAYIDNIVRVGRTFAFDRETFTLSGLATGKKSLLITPSAATPTPETDFCEPYVRAVLRFIGIERMEYVQVPNQFMSADIRSLSIEGAKAKLLQLAETW
jgi:FMN-dependent NADH-azoreductase